MRRLVKALLIGVVWSLWGAVAVFSVVFAVWILVTRVPQSAGWSAVGSWIGAVTIIAGVTAMIAFAGYLILDKRDDGEFVSWIFNSANEEYINTYKSWLKNRR